METIGASLTKIAVGEIEISLPFRDDLVQQHGFLHAGIVTTIVDNACGYAALSLMPPDTAVLTIEYKVNFLSPAIGEKMLATGRVTKPGRNVTVCHGDVFAINQEEQKFGCPTMLTTMMTVQQQGIRDLNT